jgi:TyrR family helix-turn-helix protein
MNNKSYGIARVLEPNHVLPTVAWRIDNSRKLLPNELRISLRRIHLEGTSFKQISMEANHNEDAIKSKILDIVIKRGKLHNPVTDTGGLLYGIVEEIGPEYENPKGFQVGDEVLCNTSLTTVPLYISGIRSVHKALGQIEADGYAIVFNEIPLVPKPEDLPADILLFTFNESGTLFHISKEAYGKQNILIVGNNLMMNLLYGYTVRRVVGSTANIICLLDKKTELTLKGTHIDGLISRVFTEIHYVNILKPLECMESLNLDALFDISINCADIPGAETINILATRSGGSVFFANLINNYNIGLYITESISRQLNIQCADGYLEEYDEFDIQMTKELMPYLSDVYMGNPILPKEPAYATLKNRSFKESLGYSAAVAEGFISHSPMMTQLMEEVLRVAKYDCHVLITGETGVGKEKLANIIQKNSSRKMQPYLKVNCASIAPNLMESEFFGYEKGAFTGANPSGKKGYFETGDNGILFLDEIAEIPPEMQAKLLRVLQDGEFYRVGGNQPIRTNVRILSATNKNLEDLVEKNLFRRDLYYRLNVFPIRIPPLEERQEDIPPLIQYFLETYGEKFGIKRTMEEDAVNYLSQQSFPGNVRELENLVQRLMITTPKEYISLMDVLQERNRDAFLTTPKGPSQMNLSLDQVVGQLEKALLKQARDTHGSTRKAAASLGISQTQFVRKSKKYQLSTEEEKEQG